MSAESTIRRHGTRRSTPIILGALALSLAWCGFASRQADAYQVKRVIRNTCAMASGTEVQAVSLSTMNGATGDSNCDAVNGPDLLSGVPLDPNKTLLLMSESMNATDRRITDIMGVVDDSQTLLMERIVSGTAGNVDYMVVEFASGVTVTSGITTMNENQTTKNIGLPAGITLGKAFPIITSRTFAATNGGNVSASNDERCNFTAELTSATNLKLVRSEVGASYNTDIAYQIVAFDATDPDINVQTGVAHINGSTTGETGAGKEATDNGLVVTATSGAGNFTAVDATKSMLFFTISPDAAIAGNEEQWAVDGQITNGNTLTFTRVTNTASTTVRWYLVELKDAVLAQHGRSSFTGTSPASAPTITSTVVSRSIGRFNSSGGAASTTAGLDEILVRGQIPSGSSTATSVTLTRETAQTTTVNTSYDITQLPPIHLTSPTTGNEVWLVGSTYNITWDHADDVTSSTPVDILLTTNGQATDTCATSYPLTIVSGYDPTTDVGGAPSGSNNGSYAWTIPPRIPLAGGTNLLGTASRVMVKLTSAAFVSPYNCDISNNNFQIKGSLALSTPASTPWNIGDSRTVSWNYTGDFNGKSWNGTMYYSTGGGTCSTGTWTAIPSSDGSCGGGALTLGANPNGGTESANCTWNPVTTAALGANTMLKLILNSETSPVQTCTVTPAFAIKRYLAITAPTGSSTWESKKAFNITWNYRYLPTSETVKLEYSADNGNTWNPVQDANNPGANSAAVNNSGTSYNPPTTNPGTGQYTWTIPDAAINTGGQAMVRITSNQDSSIVSTSAAFTINPSVRVLTPNGGAPTLYVGNTGTITWDCSPSSVSKVKLELCTTSNCSASTQLVTGLAAGCPNGSYSSWNIGDYIGTTNRIRITGQNSSGVDLVPAVVDTSDADFTIHGQISGVNPGSTSGTSFSYGLPITVSWTHNGSIGNVDIKLSSNGGSDGYPTLLSSACTPTPTAGTSNTCTWSNATTALGTSYKVRVVEIANSDVYADSANSFSITGRITAITYPNDGTEVWLTGTNQTITWTRSPNDTTFQPFKVEYSLAGAGGPWTVVPTSSGDCSSINGTSCTWNNIGASSLTTNLRIRVSLATDATITRTNDNPSKIRGTLQITAPNGNANPALTDYWYVGENKTITWNASPASQGDLQLVYSTDGSYPAGNNIATVTSGTLSYPWTVPTGAQGENVRIKVYNVADTGVFDTSDNDFKVRGRLDITSPDGGPPALRVDGTKNITWNTYGTVPTVKLYYSTNSTSGPWTAITSSPISNAGSPGIITGSSGGAAEWCNFGCVPNAIGTTVRIRVEDSTYPADYPGNVNLSGSDFEIKGNIDLTDAQAAPVSTDILRVGGSFLIKWLNHGTMPSSPTPNITIQYSTDGSTYNAIDGSQPLTNQTAAGLHTYNWTNIPDAARSSTTTVKVTWDGDATNVFGVSAQFKVKPTVDLTSPDSGTYHIGDSLPITFTHTGRATDVFRVLYSTNGGDAGSGTYPNPGQVIGTVTSGTVTPANGFTFGCSSTVSPVSCNWTVPNVAGIVSNNVRIKVELVGDESYVKDESLNTVTTLGSINLTYPNASNVVWTVGDTRQITYTTQGITSVAITYTKDNGIDNYGNTVTCNETGNNTATGGTCTWVIPAGASDSAQVKIKVKANDSTPGDSSTNVTSANMFRIKPKLTLTYPVGSEVFVVGSPSPQQLAWTYSGTLQFVDLYYTKDTTGDTDSDGIPDPPENTWVPIATGASAPLAGALAYPWSSVPDDITTTARVVIRKKDDSTVKDVKSAFFKIRGDLHLDQPTASGIQLPIANTYDIKWTPTGTLGNIKLEYSTNGFSDETQTGTVTGPSGSAASLAAGTSGAQQTFTWNVPNAPSPSVKVRVTSLSDATVFNKSTNNLSIVGSLFVDVPNGPSSIWEVNSTQSIQWHKFGAINNINLFYSKNGGTDSYPYRIPAGCDPSTTCNISAGPESGSSFSWTIPDDIGDQVRIKIVDANDSSVGDVSDANFMIKGKITVTTPNSTATRYVGDPLTVSWTPDGSVGPVTIQYSTNGFSNESQTTTVTTSYQDPSNAYALPSGVPDAISDTVKFRIKSQQSNASLIATDVSDFDFPVKGKLTLQPLASEYILGDSINVQWTPSGSTGNVTVEYTYDGSNWTTVTTAAPQNGPYSFTLSAANTPPIPEIATASAQIRISAVNTVSATSPAFKVKPLLQVTSPTGGNTWMATSSHAITWNQKGSNISDVKVEYSSDGGTNYQPILENQGTANDGVVANNGSVTWAVPDEIGANPNLKVRISTMPLSDAWAVAALSSGLAQIIGGLQMVTPDDTTGIKWRVNSNGNQILWNATGSIANVKLDYSVNSGTNWSPITASAPSGAGNNKSYSWNIPSNTPLAKNTVRMRVCDAANTNVCDTADASSSFLANFTIAHPDGSAGDVWVAETTNAIQWTTPQAGVPATVKLEYTLNGTTWNPVPESDGTPNDGIVSNTGTLNWTLGTSLAPLTARVRLSDPNDVDSLFTGNAFKIRGDLTMSAPNTGLESWEVNTLNNITWTKKGAITAVKLQLATDGSTYNALVDGDAKDTQNIDVTGAGPTYTFNWRIPDVAGITTTTGRIRVMDANDSTVYDPSNADFTIKGRVQLSTPNGSETLTVGVPYAITGNVYGPITGVKLYYSTNGLGGPFTALQTGNCDTVSVSAGAFSCNWNVQDLIGTNLAIKVTDATNPLVADISDAIFAIKGGVTITTPGSSNLIWYAGDPVNIVWDRTGTIGNVDLSYSVNNGSYQAIASGVASPSTSGNSYAWSVPTSSIVSNNVKIKIDGANLVAPAVSPGFTVKGKLALTYPDASGINFTLGDPLSVTWNASGDLGNVKVEYTYDGTNWTTLTTTAAQNGPYAMTLDASNTPNPVPEQATTTAKIRISAASDASVTATSANAFTVKPYLQVTSPAAGNVWVVDSAHAITWSKKGANVTDVKIEYSSDGGTTYQPVQEAEGTPNDGVVANDGSFTWTVPDEIGAGPKMKVRISTMPLAAPYAVVAPSGMNRIIGALTLTTPDDTTGVKWRINSNGNQLIWSTVGSMTNVTLDYSTDSGTTWTQISGAAPSGVAGSGKSYAWNIPNNTATAKDTVRFRVCDAANTDICDLAGASSSLLANFTLDHPTNGDVWVAETTNAIQWSTPQAGVPATVKLEYSLNGTTWNPVPENFGTANDGIVANSGTLNWTLGTGLSTSAKVRLSDPADVDSLLTGNGFKIRGSLTMTAPNTGQESWEVNTLNNITWTKKGAISAVKLQLSTNNGTSWSALVDGTTPTPQDTQNIDTTGAGPTYTFNWRIPDVPGITTTGALLRVVDANDSTVLDPSDAPFTIKGRVQLTTPNGNETLTVHVPYAITGSVFGPITTVNLYLSTNGGSTYAQLPVGNCDSVAVSAGAFSCNWDVPDQLGANLKIKVTDASNGSVADESDAVFSIKGSATITTPANTNLIWYAGDSNNIVWDRTGTIGNVDLFYSVNNGAYQAIASGIASPSTTGNSYAWTVPTDNIVSNNVKIKIDGANLVAPAVSLAFTVKGKLALTYPDASGITLTLGDPLNVTWNASGDLGNVKVEYTYDGTNWTTLTTTATTAGPYSFTLSAANTPVAVPEQATTAAKVRISAASDATVTSMSTNAFTVKPSLQVTSPTASDTWAVGSNHDITWSAKGSNVSTVKIEYSSDGGSSYQTVLENEGTANDGVVTNDGTFTWTVPDEIGAGPKMKVRVSTMPLTAPYAVVATSGGLARIIGSLTLTTPNDTTGVKWRVGSTGNQIMWNTSGSMTNVTLDYSTDSGTTWTQITNVAPSGLAGSGKSYSWNIANNTPLAKDTVRFRVCDAANTDICDTADASSSFLANFTIAHPDGDVWIAETTNAIQWSTPQAGVPANVKIEYTLDGTTWNPIPENVGTANDGIVTNTGTQNWTLGAGLSAAAKVRISDASNVDSLFTGNPFRVRGQLTLTAPDTGLESWEVATLNNITWTKKGAITAVKLELATDGVTYNALVDGDAKDTQNIDVTGAGPTYTFNWKVPDQPGILTTNAKIRVVDTGDPLFVFDPSNNPFTIKGRVQLTTPNGNQTLTVGVPYAITGSVFGPITSVNLYLSTNGGATYTQLPSGNCDSVAVTTGSFSCNWNVPDQLGANMKIKVADANNSLVLDESDAVFAIKGSATITTPANTNLIWYAGDAVTLVWDRTGTIGNVDLSYSVDNGTYQTIATGIASPTLTGNTYNWTVPTAGHIVSNNVKIKIDGANLVAPAVSLAFTVKGKLALTYPDATGITLTLGDPLNVTWNTSGDTGNVKVEYTYDGSNWTTVTTTAPEAGPYSFTLSAANTPVAIPEQATTAAKVRISATADSSVTATSANAFTVKPSLQVTSPTASDTWIVGTNHDITWNTKGSNVSTVKIEYSSDGGSSYQPILETEGTANDGVVTNDGSFTWTVPDEIGVGPKLKLRLSTMPLTAPYAVVATSNGLARIIGALTLTTPNDTTGVKWRVGSTGNQLVWSTVGSMTNVTLDYSTDSGTTWTQITNAAPSGLAGSGKNYAWAIPNATPLAKDTVRFRVCDAANTDICDTADANSSLLANFTLSHPDGDVWIAETTNAIQWSTPQAGVPSNVKIEYTLDGTTWSPITENFGTANDGIVANTGTQNWTLGTGLSASAKVRISDPGNVDSLFVGNPFRVRGQLTLTAPDTGLESWEVATLNDITWTKKGAITSVKLQLATDGVTYNALVDGDGKDTQNIDTTGAGPTYTFNWKVPDQPGILTTNAKIRVVDTGDPLFVFDPSNNPFTIKGRVQLTTPNGNQTLTVGVPYTITGNVYGPISSVNLYLSTNGGSTYAQLPSGNCDSVAVTTGTFSCNWNVPDTLGTNMKIKVSDPNNSLVFDESDATFAIKGGVTITTPANTNLIWYAGDTNTIIWDRTGTIGNVDLFYNVNDGTYQTIASAVASPTLTGNTYNWTVPTDNIVSNNVKVKIDGANLVAPAISLPFNVKGKINLIFPDAAGIELSLAANLTVTWSWAGDIGPVKIEYFDGTSWSTITNNATNIGNGTIALPLVTDIATTGAKVRISAANDSSVTDVSTNPFTVKPYVSLNSPAGNEAWVVGSQHDITWSRRGTNVSNVELRYSKDSGVSYNEVITSSTANNGTYTWTIPDDIQPVKNMKVKISTLPLTDPYAVNAVSAGLFQIIGALSMVTPNDTNGVKWRVNTLGNQILWNATGSIANVKLDYSADSGTNWSPIAASAPSGAGSNRSYSWDIPAATTLAKDTFRIRVCDAANTSICDTADANSSMLANFTLIHPTNGDVWVAETSQAVQWSTPTAGVPTTVKLDYSMDGTTWSSIVASTPNTGTKSWTLPTALSQNAKVRIADTADPVDSAIDGAPFKIRGDVTLTAPNTGLESWEVQTLNNITWTKKGAITAVKLQLATDGVTYNALVDGDGKDTQNVDTTGAGPTYTFNWKIPDVPGITSTNAKIRVMDANDATVYDPSDNAFTIKGRVQLNTPNGGETLTVGVPYAITGSVFGPITSVNLYLSTNGGATYAQLPSGNCDSVAVTTGAFSCNWNVPDQLGTNMKIKVADSANSLVFDESDAIFAIKGSTTITAPVSGNIWIAGDAYNIMWDRTGTIGNVDLLYNVNDGAYQSIASGVASPTLSGNTFSWTVPSNNIVSQNVKIKIDGANLVAPAISAAFTVKGKLLITYPNAAGLVASLGDTMNVTWNVAGDIGPVKVEYFDGTVWSTVTTTALQAGPYGLLLDAPNTTVATAAAKVRISDADDATVTSTSANAFMVKPYVQVTSPSGGEAWVVASIHNITWDKKASNVATVELRYSKNSGVSYDDVIYASAPNTGSYAWTIPDDIQPVKNMKIKVSTLPLSDPYAVTAVSSGLFQLTGALEMVTPNDTTGIKWRVNTTANEIKWNATGSVVNVRLEYSTNGDAGPWATIVSSTPSGGGANKTYSWDISSTVPLAKDNFRIRALDAANTNVYDIATANSSMLANFTIAHPSIGEVWIAGTSRDVEWTTPQTGVPSDVILDYTLDGTNWSPIVASTPNSGIKSWTLPLNLSQNARVRIADVIDPVDSAIISSPFKVRGDLTLTAPNTGQESWEIQTLNDVTWTKQGNISAVKLQLATDGSTYVPMVDGDGKDTQNIDVSGPGPVYTFNWKIPNLAGITTTNAKIRVVDANDSTVYDPSDYVFTIKGRVQLNTPNGGETLLVGNPYTITGSVFGPITGVKLFYSTDGLTFPNPVVGCETVGVSAGTFSCSWNVPDAIGTSLKIRVEDAGNPLVSDTSDATFSVKGTATVTAPLGPPAPSIWIAGQSHQIRWDRTGTIGNVDLFYSVNGGTWTSIASGVPSPSASGNAFDWTLPSNNIVSNNVKVRVDGVNLATPADSGAFTVKGKLTLTYPDASGIALSLGDTANVTWNVAGDIGPVKVEYFDGSSWSTITTTAPQNGPYGLVLDAPNTTLATAGARVRISAANDATVTAASTNAFMVKPLLQVTSPSGNEAFVVNSGQTITWNTKGSNIATVKIEYSKDGGANFNDVVSSSAPNTGSYFWQPIPDDIQAVSDMKVRISTLPLTDPFAVTAVSNGLFKVIGQLTLTAPQGTDRWGVGTSHDIKWQRIGSVLNVRLSYSTDGTNFSPIVDSYPGGNGDTGYPWTIPNVAGIVSNTVTVRVSDVIDSSVFNLSPQFKIVPSFTVTAPTLGQRLIASRPFTVTWNRNGFNPTVNLYYSKDNFSGPPIPIEMGVANTGTYVWNVPDDLFPTAMFRVAYPVDESVVGDSNPFQIAAGFTVVSPNSAADKWDVGSTQTIRWTCTSANVPTAKIEYSVDGGATYPFVIAPTANNTGAVDAQRTLTWTPVPDMITGQFKIRVTSNGDPGAFDDSDSNAKIKAHFQVLTPSNTGIVLKVGDPYNITWNWDGTVPNVRLDYSLDDFTTSTNIVATTLNDGVYEWTVPDAISTNVKVRVRSTTDVDGFDLSDNPFKIEGYFTLTTPNGGDQLAIGFPTSITWNTMGTINSVNLVAYSTMGVADPGFPYASSSPYVIASALTNNPNTSTTYSWNPVPDMASPNVRVRVVNASDSVVYTDSASNVKIQGSFTVTYPNAANEVLTVGDPATITWNKTGSSITEAKISYSTNGMSGPWTPIDENDGTANDGIVANAGSRIWTVPDVLALTTAGMPKTNLMIKIEDPNDSSVSDLSDNAFKIRGRFSFVTPAGSERWVANENHLVSWTTTGTMTKANLYYSKDGFATTNILIASNLTNAPGLNTYGWLVPDDVSTTVTLRIVDGNDSTTSADSSVFKIDHYNITFEVRDLLSNAFIDTLSVSGVNNQNPAFTWNESGLNAPVVKGLPAGPWSLTWSQSKYGDQSVGLVADRDQTVTVLMETKVVHVWEAITDLAYSAGTDTVSLSSTLRRDGITVSGASACEIKFFIPGNPMPVKTFTDPNPPDANGFYGFTWDPPTGLIGNIVYNVVTKISLSATGATITTPRTFTIAQETALQGVKDQVATKLDTPLSQVKDDVTNAVNTQLTNAQNNISTQLTNQSNNLNTQLTNQQTFIINTLNTQSTSLDNKLTDQKNTLTTQLDNQNTIVTNKLNQQTNTIQTQMDAQTSAIQHSLVSFENKTDDQVVKLQKGATDINTAGGNLLISAEHAAATNKQFAGRLMIPSSVLVNEKSVKLMYQADENLEPYITIITRDSSGKDKNTVEKQLMKASADRKDIYEYTIDSITNPPFTPGKIVTVVVEAKVFEFELDPEKKGQPVKNLSVGAFVVESTTLTGIEGLVAGQSGVKGVATDTLAAVRGLQATFGASGGGNNVIDMLGHLSKEVDKLPAEVKRAVINANQGNSTQMKNAINEVATQIKTLAGDDMGFDFSKIVGKALTDNASIKDIRKRADEVQGATEVMQILMERKMGGVDAPVVHATYK